MPCGLVLLFASCETSVCDRLSFHIEHNLMFSKLIPVNSSVSSTLLFTSSLSSRPLPSLLFSSLLLFFSSLLHFLPVHKILHLCSLRLRESCGLSIRKLSSLSLSPTAPSIRDSGKLPVFLFFFFEMVVMCREAFVAEEETIEEGEWEKER